MSALLAVEEAQALTGLSDLSEMAHFFFDRGAGACIFTLGGDGAYYSHTDGTRFHVPAFDIQVKCTCGCGDVFNAGFAAGLLNGMSPQDAVRLAQASSALNATIAVRFGSLVYQTRSPVVPLRAATAPD